MALQPSLISEPTPASAPAITPAYRRYALLILLLVFASSHVDRQILAILLEPIKHELVLSDTQLGFLSGIAFAIFYATLGIPIAMWADRSNRRNIIALALTTWSGMTVLCGMAANFLQLALARIGVTPVNRWRREGVESMKRTTSPSRGAACWGDFRPSA